MRGGNIDRTLKYDSENRLRVIEDTQNGTMSLYTYNHTGERSLKRYGAFNTAYLNGAYAGSGLDGLTRYSAYISPYYVEHGTGTNSSTATKHYYIGTERLVSKLVTEKGGKEDVKDEDTYYYFTDHLGSTTHITDKGGKVVQYAAYTPYGTLFREYKSVMPYKFNGKELDQETGYYYYGARYYDPSAVLWLGVDPLAEKYPEVSPYVYCAGNPVKYVDPDGRDTYIFNEDGSYSHSVAAKGEHTGLLLQSDGNNIGFKFADPVNDPKSIGKEDGFNRVELLTNDKISNALVNSGVEDKENQNNRWSYIINESNASNLDYEGKMDYACTANFNKSQGHQSSLGQIDAQCLYIVKCPKGIYAHNNYNLGNFLWGAGASALGFSEFTARAGAHLNNFLNDPYSKGHLDSADDQLSISLGFNWYSCYGKK